MSDKPKTVGRPKKELSELPEQWQKEIIMLYKKGGSDVEVKGLIYGWIGSFSNNLWDRWLEEEPQFWETIKMGRVLSECWWTKEGRENLTFKDFSYTGWYMNMKNRFKWTDRVDQTTQGEAISQVTVFKLPDNER